MIHSRPGDDDAVGHKAVARPREAKACAPSRGGKDCKTCPLAATCPTALALA
jgi:hypothetical protein